MTVNHDFRVLLAIAVLALAFTPEAMAAAPNALEKVPSEVTLFKNVKVFNGTDNELKAVDVLVVGNKIHKVAKEIPSSGTYEVEVETGISREINGFPTSINTYVIQSVGSSDTQTKKIGVKVIDGGGRTLMPGLLDSHVHLMLNDHPHISIYEKPWSFVGAQAVAGAKAMLLRGFTTVRDIGGPAGGLKDAIDMGLVEGPRILPSGAFISQTSGHGDLETSSFKLSPYFTGIPDKSALFGWSFVADGVPEVQKAAREVIRTGATQLKVMAGGGVSSYFDPLHTTQYTFEEVKAVVTEAEHWGTYVAVHAYTDAAVKQCVEAGVKSIEHGPFLTKETLKLMAEKGVWLSPQAYLFQMTPEDLSIVGTPAEPKMRQVNEESELVLKLAKKYNVKVAWGTDLFGPLEKQAQQPLEFRARTKYFSNFEILRQVTSDNADLFKLSGKLHPYQEGELGVIQEGAYADLLLVDGNPLEDIEVMVNPDENFDLIMKDGKIYKNTL